MKENFQELTDSQWQLIEKTVDDKRQRWHSLRTIRDSVAQLYGITVARTSQTEYHLSTLANRPLSFPSGQTERNLGTSAGQFSSN